MALPYVKNDFTSGPKRTKVLRGSFTADGAISIPAYHRITGIFVDNKTANAITGGLDLGTTAGGEEVAAAFAVGANATVSVGPQALLIDMYSAAAADLKVSAHTAWNSASIDVVVFCDIVSAADETL